MSDPSDVVIVSVARTPFGKFGGVLKHVPAIELGVTAVHGALARCALQQKDVDELAFGCCIPSESEGAASVVARQVQLESGIPADRPSVTIDRACCSALAACGWSWRSLRLGEVDVSLGGGTENMSRTPHLVRGLRWGARLGSMKLEDPLVPLAYSRYTPVSVDAGEVAMEYGVDRQMQDHWALRSQQLYEQARQAGKMADEIVPVSYTTKDGKEVHLDADEFPRPQTTIEKLGSLSTVYGSPTVTAGNAPGLDAGAAACVFMTRGHAQDLGLEALATLRLVENRCEEPRRIAAVPATVISHALKKAGWVLEDLSLIEINEAFAAMPLVSSQILSGGEGPACEKLRQRINVNGGAIAIGHPIGASGARILMTLILELRRRGGGRGAAAICGGLAQGECALVEV